MASDKRLLTDEAWDNITSRILECIDNPLAKDGAAKDMDDIDADRAARIEERDRLRALLREREVLYAAAVALADQCLANRDAPLFKTLTKSQREDMGITAKHFDAKLDAYRAAKAALGDAPGKEED